MTSPLYLLFFLKDFHKQDGVTEIEESLEANEVERRMNDLLLADEQAGVLTISRAPALVGCTTTCQAIFKKYSFKIFIWLTGSEMREREKALTDDNPLTLVTSQPLTEGWSTFISVLSNL